MCAVRLLERGKRDELGAWGVERLTMCANERRLVEDRRGPDGRGSRVVFESGPSCFQQR